MYKSKKTHSVAVDAGPFSRPFPVENARDRKESIEIVADESERTALAAFLKLPAINALRARFEITPLTRGRYEVSGNVNANVRQSCVVTLEDFDSEVVEPVEAIFAPPVRELPEKIKGKAPVVDVSVFEGEDPPEQIVNGSIDLGVLAAEYLALGLDPWPRKPDAEFGASTGDVANDETASPFAALAKLKPDRGREN